MALVSPNSGGATNWPSPSFDPDTGLFYVGTSETFSVFYLTDTDPHPEGYGAVQRGVGSYGGTLRAIDYKTGQTVGNTITQAAAAQPEFSRLLASCCSRATVRST